MQNFKMPPFMCPNCGTKLDGATDIGMSGGRPGKGDFSICLSCATILRFEEGSSLRLAEDSDFDGAPFQFVEALAEMQRMAKMNLAVAGKGDQAKPRLLN